MDLFGGYLLVLLILLAANISLLLGNYRMNNAKMAGISLFVALVSFALMFTSAYLNIPLQDYVGYLFFAVFLVIFLSMLHYSKTDNYKMPLYAISAVFAFQTILLSSQSDLSMASMILYSLFVFIILFVAYQLSKLLHHAKRQYSVIICEYMCLASILVFIFALTYDSTRALDYTMFSPFLILTPTYQLIYVVIAIIVVLVIGVLINDNRGGNS